MRYSAGVVVVVFVVGRSLATFVTPVLSLLLIAATVES